VRRFALDALTLVGLVAFVIGSHFAKVNWIDAWRAGRDGAAAQVAKVVPASGTLAVTLANGTTIELLGLANGDGAPNQWWRPDGTPIPQTVLDVQGPADMLGNDRPRTKFAFKVTGSTWAMETATYEFEPSAGISAGGQVWQNGEKIAGGWPMVAAWAHVTNQATLRFGLRFDNWRNVAVFMPNKPSRTETSTVSGDPKWIANLNHYSDDGSNTLVTAVLNRESRHWRMRLVAVDGDGKQHFYHRANVTPAESTETWTCTFPNLTVDRIEKFQVQVQPVHWVEFRNVPLQPAGPLPPIPTREVVTKVTDQPAVEDPRTGAWFAELPGGGRVELLAIGEPDAAPAGWWRPGGEPVTNTTFAVQDAGPVFAPAGRPWDLVFRFANLPEGT
ncbi:MAG TPA: hypothetical protein VLD18_16735, partial [Verrucomicrobiae bacterium]|nr:hypothetical protein [Verrucomicrobiae bacterium]